MTPRFSHVVFDGEASHTKSQLKLAFERIEFLIDILSNGRAKALAFTKLEECYMWAGKAVRDDQLAREQTERKDG